MIKMKIKIVFTGSRDLTKPEVENVLRKYLFDYIFLGDCNTGGDKFALEYAIKNNIKYKIFKAQWEKFGKRAGPIRNERMVKYVKQYYFNPYGIAIRKNKSPGTSNCISYFLKYGLNYKIYDI